MKKKGLYTTGEFARAAHVSLRTVRWYDRQDVLKPSFHTDGGNRIYTDRDLAKLQQILLFKYLGFSLEDIKQMTAGDVNREEIMRSLDLQKKLTLSKISQMQSVAAALDEVEGKLEGNQKVDWSQLLRFFHEKTMEETLRDQYRSAANIAARIRLHQDFSVNPEGWYPWLLRQYSLKQNMHVLETGCGNGELWMENRGRIPAGMHVILSDASAGMSDEVRKRFAQDERFVARTFPIEEIPYADNSFDLVIANHMLFYCADIDAALIEVKRVLKKNGVFACSAYGADHMKEITELVQGFDSSIVLSADKLYEKFGLENGKELLSRYFRDIEERKYDDAIEINQAEPLIAYILSCHGNQNEIILNRYHDFHAYVNEKVKNGFHITKDAGMFMGRK